MKKLFIFVITILPFFTTAQNIGYTTESVRLREEANSHSRIIRWLEPNEKLILNKKISNFYSVKVKSTNEKGYVHQDYISNNTLIHKDKKRDETVISGSIEYGATTKQVDIYMSSSEFKYEKAKSLEQNTNGIKMLTKYYKKQTSLDMKLKFFFFHENHLLSKGVIKICLDDDFFSCSQSQTAKNYHYIEDSLYSDALGNYHFITDTIKAGKNVVIHIEGRDKKLTMILGQSTAQGFSE